MQALQPIIVPLFLIFVGSILTFMASWYWFTKSSRVRLAEELAEARVKEADRLALANEKLLARLTELEKQQGIMGQQILPISTAFQSILIKELTHLHTPEMDALLVKLGPPYTLNPEDESRLKELLKQRMHDMGAEIPDSERDAAMMLPMLMKRAKQEAEAMKDVKIVVIPQQPTTTTTTEQ